MPRKPRKKSAESSPTSRVEPSPAIELTRKTPLNHLTPPAGDGKIIGMHSLIHLDHVWPQIFSLSVAFVLCSLLGIERDYHQKNAGVKTHVLVGVGACIFTLVSAYGFAPVLGDDIHLDPSRIAAQVVSGIGFLGAGVIFVNHDTVRGLTTAATIWLSAAIGMACGASMEALGLYALLLHFLAVFIVGPLVSRIPSTSRNQRTVIEYHSQRGVMRQIMLTATQHGYKAEVNSTSPIKLEEGEGMRVVMKFDGYQPQTALLKALRELPGVCAVDTVKRDALD